MNSPDSILAIATLRPAMWVLMVCSAALGRLFTGMAFSLPVLARAAFGSSVAIMASSDIMMVLIVLSWL